MEVPAIELNDKETKSQQGNNLPMNVALISNIQIIEPSRENSLTFGEAMEKLLKDGVAEIISARNRKLIYHHCLTNKILFRAEVIGYLPLSSPCNTEEFIKHSRKISYWKGNNKLEEAAKLIFSKRLLAEDLEKTCLYYNNMIDGGEERKTLGWNFEDVRLAFANGLTSREIYIILDVAWGDKIKNNKYNPLTSCYIRKTVVRISLIHKPMVEKV